MGSNLVLKGDFGVHSSNEWRHVSAKRPHILNMRGKTFEFCSWAYLFNEIVVGLRTIFKTNLPYDLMEYNFTKFTTHQSCYLYGESFLMFAVKKNLDVHF